MRKAPNGAAKILINGNYMEVYNPQGEEDELLEGDQKEAYIWPANGQISHGQQNNNSDDAPLHAAVRNRKPDVVRFRLDNGGDVKSKDKLGNTPLHLAIVTGQANIVKVLLDRRAKTSKRNSNYNTPLHLVVQNGQMETAKLLLNRQADLAALNGKVDVVKLLRKGGADVEAKDTDENKPLQSCKSGRQKGCDQATSWSRKPMVEQFITVTHSPSCITVWGNRIGEAASD